MDNINNKAGPDFDVGSATIRRLLYGAENKPRDGTEGMPRDGTQRMPRDGTEGKPRDKIILRMGNLVTRYYYRNTGPLADNRVCIRLSSKWRTPVLRKPALRTGMGRGMSCG